MRCTWRWRDRRRDAGSRGCLVLDDWLFGLFWHFGSSGLGAHIGPVLQVLINGFVDAEAAIGVSARSGVNCDRVALISDVPINRAAAFAGTGIEAVVDEGVVNV